MVKGSVVANSPLLPEKELGQAPFVAAHARNVPTVRVSPRIWRRMLPQSRSTVKSSIPMLMAEEEDDAAHAAAGPAGLAFPVIQDGNVILPGGGVLQPGTGAFTERDFQRRFLPVQKRLHLPV